MTYEQKKAEDEGRIPKTEPRTYAPLSKEEMEKKSFGEKVKDFSKGVVDKAKDRFGELQKKETPVYENPKQDVTYREQGDTTKNQNALQTAYGQTPDLIKAGVETGDKASKSIQNVDVPRAKMMNYADIIRNPEMEGQRANWILNSLKSGLASALSGKDYQSNLNKYNQAMAENYAQNVASRDTAATKAAVEDIEAGNKAEMGKQVQMSDSVMENALKRYGLLEDTETKRQVLQQLMKDAVQNPTASVWKDLNADEQLAVMSLMQVYNGDYTLGSMLLQKYGDDFMAIIDGLMNKLGLTGDKKQGGGSNGPTPSQAITLSTGEQVDPAQVKTKEEKQKIIEDILNDNTLNPQQKYKKAQQFDQTTQVLGGVNGTYNVANKDISEGVGWGVEKQLNDTNDFTKAIDDINIKLNAGKISGQEALSKLNELEGKYDTISDPVGMYRVQLNGLIRDAQSAIVTEEIKGIMDNPELDSVSKKEYLKDIQTKYPGYVAQDPSLKKDIDNQLTSLNFNIVYQDPYVKNFTSDFTKSVGVGKKDKYNKSFKIKNDGNIEVYDVDGKKIGFVNFNENPASVKYEDVINYIKNNTSIENVRKSMGGNLTNEQLAFTFKTSPIYKVLQRAATGTMTQHYPEISKELYNIYNSWENLK